MWHAVRACVRVVGTNTVDQVRCYRALCGAVIREGSEMDTSKAGVVYQGELVWGLQPPPHSAAAPGRGAPAIHGGVQVHKILAPPPPP
eukprot:COSAG01_NODE_10844_length_2069_cov_0.928426_2_plen_87_part_01